MLPFFVCDRGCSGGDLVGFSSKRFRAVENLTREEEAHWDQEASASLLWIPFSMTVLDALLRCLTPLIVCSFFLIFRFKIILVIVF